MDRFLPAAAVWLLCVDLFAFFLMGADKRLAVRRRRRIPEKALFAAALLGGAAGSLLGMLVFRHKTRHPAFVIGMPLILLLQVLAAVYLLRS